MIFEFSNNDYIEYLKKEYLNFTKVNIKLIENGVEENHVVVIPVEWLDKGYIAIDNDGGITIFNDYPNIHEQSKTWDINDFYEDFVEIGSINRDVTDWEEMLQPIGNANFIL